MLYSASSSHKIIPLNEPPENEQPHHEHTDPLPQSPSSPSPDGNLSQIELTEARLMQLDNLPPSLLQPGGEGNEEAKSEASNSDHGDDNYDGANDPLMMDYKAFKKRSKWQKFLQRFFSLSYYDIKLTVRYLMESFSIQISISVEDFIMLITIFVLFATDILVLSTPAYTDGPISTTYFVCFLIFATEFVINTWCKTDIYSLRPFVYEGYLFSFFWWLDLISTLSLIPDISILADPTGLGTLADAISGNASYTQAGRVVRLVRLVRLVRIYRIAAEKRSRQEHEEALVELARIGALSWEEVESQKMLFNQRQSRLGKQLSESITRRVIIMILILLIIIPILIYSPSNDGPDFGAIAFNSFNLAQDVTPDAKTAAVNALWDGFTSSGNDNRYIEKLVMTPSITPNPYIYYPGSLESIRDNAILEWQYNTTVNGVVYYTHVIYSLNYYLRQIALYDILTTIFVAIMMIGGAVIFSNDAEQLVIKPIERMVTLVEAVAQNPLGKFEPFDMGEDDKTGQYETKLLETTVGKITSLLRVGFGEAGAGIISANLSASSGSATINPLLPGVRIYAIFGFCDIHQFEDINQKLSNDVLIFINTVADIVHNSVHTWSGQVNKNLGNAFVVVWRIGDEVTLKNQISGMRVGGAAKNRSSFLESTKSMSMSQRSETSSNNGSDSELETNSLHGSETTVVKKKITIDLRRVPGVDRLADHALIGYLKIITEINRNRGVLKYRHEPRLTENGKQEYKLRMGFGLHAGWAIEGAVGSIQKVDATYLSPHVNMAARLETSSRQYGVPLLASNDFYELLSPEAQTYCRRVDKVTVKGSEVPIEIYTYDALQEQEFKDNRSLARSSFEQRALQSRKSYEKGLSAKLPMKESPNGTFIMANGAPSTPHSTHGHNNISVHGLSAHGASPTGSGTSSPVRRPSMQFNQVPGSAKANIVFLTPDDQTSDVFESDYDLITLRQHVTVDFVETFKAGVTAYLNGEWLAAKECLERADSMMLELAPALGGDGPSKTLLSYMKNREYKPPDDWKGFRPLTSK
eukprot:gene4263-4566_t